jgi:transcriptional regulator with XRE-family HTH domain
VTKEAPVDETDTIGTRLRFLRRYRGMTQAVLGDLAGLSPSAISMIENGQLPLDRRSRISALAAALRVSETDLVGTAPHTGIDPQQSGPHSVIPALRSALFTNSLTRPATDRARPATELAAEARDVARLLRRCDFMAVGQRLPGLLDELHYLAAAGSGEDERKLALAALVEACVTAAFTAKGLGYEDLGHVAALRAEEAASLLGDPAAQGKAAFLRFHTAPREMEAWDRSRIVAEHAAAALQSLAADAPAASIAGLLTLSAALASAVLQDEAAAGHWLSEAAALADRVPDDMDANWQSFGMTNVAVWRTAVAIERGEDGGKVLELARAVNEQKLTAGSRRADFLADVGRGLARDTKTRPQAMQWLRRAEDAGPQRIRNSPAARDTVAFLLHRARTDAGGRELRGMAARMGIPH